MRWIAGALIALFTVTSAALVGGLVAARWSKPTLQANHAPPPHAQRGMVLFQVHCAKCHGAEGRGDAEAAEKMQPPPRDFASRPWKFAPTAESIDRIIRRGSPGTGMPGFASALSDSDIAALTTEVLALSASPDSKPISDPFRAAGFSRLAAGRPAPALKLIDASGRALSLEALHGQLVLINFWGTNCPHCLSRMPELAQLQQRYADRPLTILNICADEDDATVAQAILPDKTASPLVTYVDAGGLAVAKYEVSLLPTYWLIDAQGNLLAKGQGARDWNDPALGKLLDELLAR